MGQVDILLRRMSSPLVFLKDRPVDVWHLEQLQAGFMRQAVARSHEVFPRVRRGSLKAACVKTGLMDKLRKYESAA
jgi:hypothetical protein